MAHCSALHSCYGAADDVFSPSVLAHASIAAQIHWARPPSSNEHGLWWPVIQPRGTAKAQLRSSCSVKFNASCQLPAALQLVQRWRIFLWRMSHRQQGQMIRRMWALLECRGMQGRSGSPCGRAR